MYKWQRRLQDEGFVGLEDKSSVPEASNGLLKSERELVLKKAVEYPEFKHRKLAHQMFRDTNHFISESSVYRVLKIADLIRENKIRLNASAKSDDQPKRINERWHTDISYIPCGFRADGSRIFWYLVTVLDGYSRFVIAWDLFPTMQKENVEEVVKEAFFYSFIKFPGFIEALPELVNDNGSQFRAKTFKDLLVELGIEQRFIAVRHPESNGKIEVLHKTLKYEDVYVYEYDSPVSCKAGIGRFFEFYNTKRPHQALDYRTPFEVHFGLNVDYKERRKLAKIIAKEQRKWRFTPSSKAGHVSIEVLEPQNEMETSLESFKTLLTNLPV